jgi:hypothetical protein
MGVAACGDTRRLRARHDLSDIHVFSGNSPGMPYLPWGDEQIPDAGLFG